MQQSTQKQSGIVFAMFAAFAFIWTSLCLVSVPPALAGLDEELEAAPSSWERAKDFLSNLIKTEPEKVEQEGATTRGATDTVGTTTKDATDTVETTTKGATKGDNDKVTILADPYRNGTDKPNKLVTILADPYRNGTDKPNKLIAGKRDLHIRWQGGEGPYRLNLMKKENGIKTPVIQETTTREHQADLSQVDLKPGVYILVIKDSPAFAENPDPAYGPAVMMDLEVLPPETRPSMPQNLADAPCSQNMKQFLYAGWLTKQGDGEWTLEAMQLVRPLIADSQKATAWMEQWGGK